MHEGELPLGVVAGLVHAEHALSLVAIGRGAAGVTPEGILVVKFSGLRVHYFRDRYRAIEFYPHAHSARCESLVLAGSIEDRRHKIGPLGEPVDVYGYDRGAMRRVGPELLERPSSTRYGVGESYALEHDAIHSTDAADQTLTLFRVLDEPRAPRAYVPAGKSIGTFGSCRVATPDEVAEAWGFVGGKLRQAGVQR